MFFVVVLLFRVSAVNIFCSYASECKHCSPEVTQTKFWQSVFYLFGTELCIIKTIHVFASKCCCAHRPLPCTSLLAILCIAHVRTSNSCFALSLFLILFPYHYVCRYL